ncbi:MAG: ribosome biogenesis GTP-binding protein YihA/YsxC [Acidobacteriota bacterium]|nr:ribosome biogenesis GTP-binding protein YihA/YsxC [Acidobacteriota bacterium]
MKVRAKFLTSAVDPAKFPAPTVPEIAFAGRSNVGKSSLLNALAGGKLAHVSSTPGRTRTINFFGINFDAGNTKTAKPEPELLLVDLPGYGYAKISKSISAEWPTFIEPYLRDRETLALCVCLVDSSIPPQPSDHQLITWLRQHQRPFLMVGTKADKLSHNKLRASLTELQVAHEVGAVLPFSAETGAGLKELWQMIFEATNEADGGE